MQCFPWCGPEKSCITIFDKNGDSQALAMIYQIKIFGGGFKDSFLKRSLGNLDAHSILSTTT